MQHDLSNTISLAVWDVPMPVVAGEKFSIKEFHNVLLRTGTVPLAILGEVVDDWIVTEKAKR